MSISDPPEKQMVSILKGEKMFFLLKKHHMQGMRISISVLLVLFCLPAFLYCDEALFQKGEEYSKEKVELIYLAEKLKERIQANKDEIDNLSLEKRWLENRVKRLEELQVHVPLRVYNSLELKQKKINVNISENKRLGVLLEKQLQKIKNSRKLPINYPGSTGEIISEDINERGMPEGFEKELYQNIKKAGLSDWVELAKGSECCSLQNSLPILFPSGSASLAKEYKVFLKQLAHMLKKYKIHIRVNGYADVDSIHTKKYPSNFELGAARAANIVHELVKNGIKPSVFEIGSTGRYRPDAKGMSRKKAFERRAEITVIFIS